MDKRALEMLLRWKQQPQLMVRELFGVTPDAWQDEALAAFPTNPRLAMKAAVGVGKTSVLAWLGWNFLLTRPHAMIGAISVNSANLKSNLWAELVRWRDRAKLPILKSEFETTEKAIFKRDHPQTWRIEARSWARDADAEQIGNALAGLHANYVMWLMDETGDYPDAVLPVCEGIFSGLPIEAHIAQAGNPTRRSGPLWRACTIARDLWHVVPITADPDDPKRSPRVAIEVARQQIRQYGRENPWVKVRILGEFPEADFNALIGSDEVEAAMERIYNEYQVGPVAMVLGVDVAREGDDASVIFPRKGIQAFTPKKLRNVNSLTGAGMVARMWDDMAVDGVFVDATGGFGSGWIDQLGVLGKTPIGITFSSQASKSTRYENKRTEMYFETVEWIKKGGALPRVPELVAALSQTNYTFKKDRLLLEPKEIIKVKLGYSPDDADALALTFAEPVTPKPKGLQPARRPYVTQANFDPFADAMRLAEGYGSNAYDPLDPYRR
jgi:phage terminase large subunit